MKIQASIREIHDKIKMITEMPTLIKCCKEKEGLK